MPETFGDRLRKQRELRGIHLAAIAEDTKISVGLLDALEHNDLSHWPTGIFRRSFVRSYARAVGLDPEVTIREFLESYPDPASDAAPASAEHMGAADLSERKERNGGGVRSRFGLMVHALTANRHVNERISFGHLVAPALISASPVPSPVQPTESIRERESSPVALASRIDLTMLAKFCTNLAAVRRIDETVTLLEALGPMLGTLGTIIWQARPDDARLAPIAACGYPPSLLARIPDVPCDAENATAAAYRSAEIRIVAGNDRENGGLAVPIFGTSGCVGVLAMELAAGAERDQDVQAVSGIVAAQLSRVLAPRLAPDVRKLA